MKTQNAKFKIQKSGVSHTVDLKTRCYKFSLAVLKYVDTFPQKRSAWVTADQLSRPSTSIGANLVEAKVSSTRKEFKWFNEIALKSANESLYWLALSRDSEIGNKIEADRLITECSELANMIASGVMKLKRQPE